MKAVRFNCLANNRTREYLASYQVWNQPNHKKQMKAAADAVKAAHNTLKLVTIWLERNCPTYNDDTKRVHPFAHLAVIDVHERFTVEWKAVQHTIHQLEAIQKQIAESVVA
jgi:hypothetical protein